MKNNNTRFYLDRRWLLDKYWGDELSLGEIATQCYVDKSQPHYWMRKFNIPMRSMSYSSHLARRKTRRSVKITSILEQFIAGELLGDMCVFPNSSYTAHIAYASKYKEYVVWLSNFLNGYNFKQAGVIRPYVHENCVTYQYESCASEYLMTVRKKWYPNGIKIVPRDIELTPLVCRQFYIGDGCLHHSRTSNRSDSCGLATCGFTKEDVLFLVDKLNKLGFSCKRQDRSNKIGIATTSTKAFLDYITPCPIECYQYKWDYTVRKDLRYKQ